MDITKLRPDLPVVLTDWFDTPEYTGFSTLHFAVQDNASMGACGREGLPYEYYTALLSPEDDMLCAACVDIARTLYEELIEEEGY